MILCTTVYVHKYLEWLYWQNPPRGLAAERPDAVLSPLLSVVLIVSWGRQRIQSSYGERCISVSRAVKMLLAMNVTPELWCRLSARNRFGKPRWSLSSPQTGKLVGKLQTSPVLYQRSGDLSQSEHWFTVAVEENRLWRPPWFDSHRSLEQHHSDEAIGFSSKRWRFSLMPTGTTTRWSPLEQCPVFRRPRSL